MQLSWNYWTLGILKLTLPTYCLGQTATFQVLGDIPGGEYGSAATAISADGTTVVGWSFVGDLPHDTRSRAFLWRDGAMLDLGTLPGRLESVAVAVNADGTIVIGNCYFADQPFRWSSSAGLVPLELPPGAIEGRAFALSAKGDVVVGGSRLIGSPNSAFRWIAPGNSTFLPTQPGHNGAVIRMALATAVSSDGEVIYGSSELLGLPWLRYTTSNLFSVPSFLDGFRFPNAVSADGRFVALSDGTDQAGGVGRIWSEKEGFSGVAGACAISGDGTVSVGWIGTPQPDRAIIWDSENGSRDLQNVLTDLYCIDLAGIRLLRATGISSDGRSIVGWAERLPGNLMEAFLVRLGNPREGDLNGDGDIDLADLTRLLSVFGSASDNCTNLVGDVNTDGVVDLSDLTITLSNFGRACE